MEQKNTFYRMVCLLLWLFCIWIFTTLNFSNNTSAGGKISSCVCPMVILFVNLRGSSYWWWSENVLCTHGLSINVSTFPHELESATIGENSTNALEFLFAVVIIFFKHYTTSQATSATICGFWAGVHSVLEAVFAPCVWIWIWETFLIFKSFPV